MIWTNGFTKILNSHSPYPNLIITFKEDPCIFDNVEIDFVQWQNYDQTFYCSCRLQLGIGKHSIEVAMEELKARGWKLG